MGTTKKISNIGEEEIRSNIVEHHRRVSAADIRNKALDRKRLPRRARTQGEPHESCPAAAENRGELPSAWKKHPAPRSSCPPELTGLSSVFNSHGRGGYMMKGQLRNPMVGRTLTRKEL